QSDRSGLQARARSGATSRNRVRAPRKTCKTPDPSFNSPNQLPATQKRRHAWIVPILVELRHKPAERLHNPARLYSQRHLLTSTVRVAIRRCARHRTCKGLVPREPRTAIVPKRSRMGFGEITRVVVCPVALVGLGEHERERPAFNATSAPRVRVLI